jgi:hypothetical protein
LSTKSGKIGASILAASIIFGGHKIIEKIYYNYEKKKFIEEFICWFKFNKNIHKKGNPDNRYYKLILEKTLSNYLQSIPSKKLIIHVQQLKKINADIIDSLSKKNEQLNIKNSENENIEKPDYNNNFSTKQILLYELITYYGVLPNSITYNIEYYENLKNYFEKQQLEELEKLEQQKQETINKFNLFSQYENINNKKKVPYNESPY